LLRLLTLSLVIVFPLFSGGLQSTQAQDNFLTYENPDIEIRMQYPADWTRQEDNLVNNAIVVFYAPQTDNSTEVNLKVIPVDEEETIDTLAEQVTNRTGFGSNAKTTNSSRTTLNGLPAIEVTFYDFGQRSIFTKLMGGSEPTTKKGLQVWTLDSNNNVSYGITYLAPPTEFEKYLPAARQMISSFQLVNSSVS
jgi:PsbP